AGFATAALIGTVAAPASAQSVIIINNSTPHYRGNHKPTVGNFIYGSPIPTPIPVNPVTGHTPRQSYFSKPRRSRTIYNPTLVNPVLVQPTIVNPTIIKTPRNRRRYRNSRRRGYRQPASRILINSPW
ncbi:MAG: hypothetical protein AAF630_08560, partial [Cyanobacteria bacterium P01_C01_bin.38]